MNQVILYTFTEEIFLADIAAKIAKLHGNNDDIAVRETIKNHPKFKQNFQLFLEFLFDRLQKTLAQRCEKINLYPVEFGQITVTNGYVKADCNYKQGSFDAIMSMVYLPLHSKHDYSAKDLECAAHTYFWWEEQENEITYQKILELFDFASQESKSMDFEVISDFKGKVFGVEIDNQAIYDSMTYLYDVMTDDRPDIFDDKINIGQLVIDLMHAFKRQFYKTDCTDIDIENELAGCISSPDIFSELRFEVFNSDLYFTDINEKIKNGDYLIKNT